MSVVGNEAGLSLTLARLWFNNPIIKRTPESRTIIMVGTILSVVTFLLLYALILAIDGKERNLNTARLGIALLVPLAISTIIGFGSPVLGSAGLAGWLSVAAIVVLTYLMLRMYLGLPARLSSIYTIALAVTNSIVQSIWFYWLVDSA